MTSAVLALLLTACGTADEATNTKNDVTEEQTTASNTETNVEVDQAQKNTEATEQPQSSSTDTSTTENKTDDNASTNGDQSSSTNSGAQQAAQEQKVLTLYASDAEAINIEPYELTYTGSKDELVRYIFEEVESFETNLNEYKFENDGKTLVLDIDDTIFNVQGSTGGTMYANTIAQSYFENFPTLQEVMFTYNGSTEPVLDHLNIGQPYTREAITNIVK